jgi:hypothetical protein
MATRPIPLRAWQVSAALDDRLSVLARVEVHHRNIDNTEEKT